jgi:hypothetical protein
VLLLLLLGVGQHLPLAMQQTLGALLVLLGRLE